MRTYIICGWQTDLHGILYRGIRKTHRDEQPWLLMPGLLFFYCSENADIFRGRHFFASLSVSLRSTENESRSRISIVPVCSSLRFPSVCAKPIIICVHHCIQIFSISIHIAGRTAGTELLTSTPLSFVPLLASTYTARSP